MKRSASAREIVDAMMDQRDEKRDEQGKFIRN